MTSSVSLSRMLSRGLRRRCPNCGSDALFRSWLETRSSCPGCGLRPNRGESDFFLGGYTLNFIAVELVLVGFLVLAVVLLWPDVPWTALTWVGGALMIVAPIAFFPVSRTLWLAIDLSMRPPVPSDFADGGEGEKAGPRGPGEPGPGPRGGRVS